MLLRLSQLITEPNALKLRGKFNLSSFKLWMLDIVFYNGKAEFCNGLPQTDHGFNCFLSLFIRECSKVQYLQMQTVFEYRSFTEEFKLK